jgi:hypothetical protein
MFDGQDLDWILGNEKKRFWVERRRESEGERNDSLYFGAKWDETLRSITFGLIGLFSKLNNEKDLFIFSC